MLYGLTIFLSAFLLFQVQFVMGKQLLPWFGGTPGVWATCFVFFQALLLAGYAYAHLLGKERNRRMQGWFHVSMLAAALVPLVVFAINGGAPLLPPEGFKPTGHEDPMRKLLGTLALSVGIPFFVMSATSPLLQRWHSADATSLDRTYRLYGLSNAGSLLGLVSYPLGFEWMFDLTQQAWIWFTLFVVFAVGCAAIALKGKPSAMPADVSAEPLPVTPLPTGSAPEESTSVNPRPSRAAPALWILLPFASSALLLASTNHLSQDVAAVPLLWMLPLAVYLLTFIICFDRPHWYSRRIISSTGVFTIAIIAVIDRSLTLGLGLQVVAFAVFIFLFCFVCHGELARLRPARERLTEYYLAIAFGGALGGAFVGLLAPKWFHDIWELEFSILLGWVLFATAFSLDRRSPFFTGDRWLFTLLVAAVLFFVARKLLPGFGIDDPTSETNRVAWIAAAIALAGTIVVRVLLRARQFSSWFIWPWVFVCAVMVTGSAALWRKVNATDDGEFIAGRNFFGVLRVAVYSVSSGQMVARLQHGNINHGMQVLEPPSESMTPTTYYAPSSGVGLAARYMYRREIPPMDDEGNFTGVHIGVLGLGTGTIAAYAEPGDRVRFYDINPLVLALSSGEKPIFTFVRDCEGTVETVLGDARLSLETELAEGEPQKFDLLAIDVFSGDAIPMHLLTSEAFDVYKAHMRDAHSIIAVHVSNRFLDLEPVVVAQARRLGLQVMIIENVGDSALEFSSTWVLLVEDPWFFDREEVRTEALEPGEEEIVFTDRFSNLLRILKGDWLHGLRDWFREL